MADGGAGDARRCRRCVLPASYPGLTIDETGVCSFCARPAARRPGDDAAGLAALARRARDPARPYDVIVPCSGGKDSCYALLVVTRRLGLRALAVNFDNGFRTPAAERNLAAVTGRLGARLVCLRPEWALMRDVYAAFLRDPGEFCSACNGMGYLVIMSFVAREQARYRARIPVIGGWSAELESMPGMYSFDIGYFRDVVAGAGFAGRVTGSPLVDPGCLELLLAAPDPRVPGAVAGAAVHFVQLPGLVEWDHRQMAARLESEAGWTAPAGDETHFDCSAYPVARWLEQEKYGFSQTAVTLAALVRTGQLDRAAALERLGREPSGRPRELDGFLDRLGLAEGDINRQGRWHPERAGR